MALALLWAGIAAAEVAVPDLRARVTDQTGTLDPGQRASLESRLAAFEREKGSQLAVLIVPTTQPETIEQFGIRVAEAWKLGRKGVDDGAILIVAKDDRALRIEVGYGLEGPVPDAIANRIVEETIVPRFKGGDFAGGIESGVDQLIGVIEGEPLPPPKRTAPPALPSDAALLLMIMAPLMVGGFVRAAVNRFSGATAAGAVAGGLGWWLTGAAGAALGLAVFCFLLILVGGMGGGRRGGSGGWSGGGGGFGGGGASGRW